ncbi:unnamed protein product [Thelazia callipaeda]|uniref:M_domain domain-containing protein n=1 Tax=Thelazia callipaeda TaxID=103827 RepID=A0A0N5CXQ2_THECL|nr:unnamed protein product [Thelazia callipaeda]
MWPSGSGIRNPNTSAVVPNSTSNSTSAGLSTVTGTSGSQSYTGIRVNDQRGNVINQRWHEHQQAHQWTAAHWSPHVASGPSPPHAWPLAASQPWSPPSNVGTGMSTYAEHAKKNTAGRGNSSNHNQIQSRYDHQQQQWNQIKADQARKILSYHSPLTFKGVHLQQTPWDTSSLVSFNAIQGGSDAKVSGTVEWNSMAAPNARWAGNQWPFYPAVTSSPAAPDWATAAAVVAAAAAAHHRHDGTAPQWTSPAVVPHPASALPPQPTAAWNQAPTAGPQPPVTALPNPNEQYDPNPQTPGPWVAPQPQEMNNDMMWHDPNPKQKKVQRDTGTAIWGDPHQQPAEIKRWKETEGDDYSHIQSAMPSGGDWNNLTVISNGNTVCSSINGIVASAGGHTASSCCSATGTNVSTPTTAGNGPWPDSSSHPDPSSSNYQERWQQQQSSWVDKLESVGDSHQTPDLSTCPPSVGAVGMHALVDNVLIRSDIGSSGIIGPMPYTSLTQQIADRIRIAVSKGLIDVAMLSRPLPQSVLVILNTLLQKFPKLEQAQQEYQQVMRTMSSPAQKIESERLAVEISGLQHEIIQLRNSMNEQLLKARSNIPVNESVIPTPQQDGQSRLQQWKQANAQDCNTDKARKIFLRPMCLPSSDPNVAGLINNAQGMSLEEKIDWKAGTLDWSPPQSGNEEKTVDIAEKDDPGSSSGEKQQQGASSSTNQSGNGTPTPQQSQLQIQVASMDDGPQEFVPGKKWEWRDPNKVAEDPNATPGTCKPNPLLSASSSAQPFYLYGSNTNNILPQGSTTNASNVMNTAANYLNDLQTMNRSPSAGYLGWNGGVNNSATAFGDIWPTVTAGSVALRQSRVTSGPTGMGPFGHTGVRALGSGTAVLGPFQRSNANSFNLQQPQQHPWIFVPLQGMNEKQVQMLCQKVGQILHVFCPQGAPFMCIRFIEPAEEVIRRLRTEAPFLQLKVLTEPEIDRLLKPRATLSYGSPMGPAGVAEPWIFGGGGSVSTILPNSGGNSDILPQQSHFHASDVTNDLARPF